MITRQLYVNLKILGFSQIPANRVWKCLLNSLYLSGRVVAEDVQGPEFDFQHWELLDVSFLTSETSGVDLYISKDFCSFLLSYNISSTQNKVSILFFPEVIQNI